MSLIITIGRQFGSSGRDVGENGSILTYLFMTRSLLNLRHKRAISAKRR